MKVSPATILILPALVNGYSVGGSMFGRPVVIRQASCAGGPCAGEVWSTSPRRRQFRRRQQQMMSMNEESIRQQKELMNRFFELAKDITTELSNDSPTPVTSTDATKRQKQQEKWVNRAFGIAQDVASGTSSPRYEVDDTDDMFQVALDVPGVPASTIQVDIVEEQDGQKVMKIKGERKLRRAGDDEEPRTVKFNKSFSLDSTADTDNITAQLQNGVLLVSVPKIVKETSSKSVPITVSTDTTGNDELTVDISSEVKDEENADSTEEQGEETEDDTEV